MKCNYKMHCFFVLLFLFKATSKTRGGSRVSISRHINVSSGGFGSSGGSHSSTGSGSSGGSDSTVGSGSSGGYSSNGGLSSIGGSTSSLVFSSNVGHGISLPSERVFGSIGVSGSTGGFGNTGGFGSSGHSVLLPKEHVFGSNGGYSISIPSESFSKKIHSIGSNSNNNYGLNLNIGSNEYNSGQSLRGSTHGNQRNHHYPEGALRNFRPVSSGMIYNCIPSYYTRKNQNH